MVAAGDPIESTDVTTVEDYTIRKPIGRIVASGAQSITDNTLTALTFSGTDEIDTHGFHDPVTNNSRVTPNVAGYYMFRGTYFTGGRTDYVTTEVCILKNGAAVAPADRRIFSTAATQVSNAFAMQTEVEQAANGTTDYFEVGALQDNAANAAQNTNQSQRFSSVFEWEFLRPL